jgi:uncharacterized protein with PQ loop repeat
MPQEQIDYNQFNLVATVGTLLALMLYSSHLSNVNSRRRLLQQGLGPMNPYLDLYSVSSNLIWLIYGFMMNNWYVHGLEVLLCSVSADMPVVHDVLTMRSFPPPTHTGTL